MTRTGSDQGAGDPDFMLSLARGLDVIRAFGQGRPLTAVEAARSAGISTSSARRCLHTLTSLGYVQSLGGRYELTQSILSLSRAYFTSASIAHLAQPVLEAAADRVQQCFICAVLDEDDVVCVARAIGHPRGAYTPRVGSRLPALYSSFGRVLVAAADPASRESLIEMGGHGDTVDKAALRSELASVGQQGHALVDQEVDVGVQSLAVPVRREGVVIAAVGVVLGAERCGPLTLRTEMLPVLRQVADEIAGAGECASRSRRAARSADQLLPVSPNRRQNGAVGHRLPAVR